MTTKKFDCVQMKHEIQQRLLAEMAGLSPEDRRHLTEERISSDPVLGKLWKHARRVAVGGKHAT